MSQKSEDRHSIHRKTFTVRLEPDTASDVEKYQEERKLTYNQTFEALIRRAFSSSSEFLDYQKCEFRSEIPRWFGKFVNCTRGGRKRTIKEEQCLACSRFKVIRVPFMTREKVEEILRERQQVLRSVNEEIEKHEPRTLRNMEQNLEVARELIADKDKSFKKLEKRLDDVLLQLNRSETDNEYLRSICTESLGKFHSLPTESMKATEPIRSEESRRIVERVVEEKKTTTTEKFLQAQPPEPKTLSGLVFCPDIKEQVSIVHICETKCETQTKFHCAPYLEMLKKKALGISNEKT
jgi:hypothetical protein